MARRVVLRPAVRPAPSSPSSTALVTVAERVVSTAPRETVLALARAASGRLCRVPRPADGRRSADVALLDRLVATTRRDGAPGTRAVVLTETAAALLALRGAGAAPGASVLGAGTTAAYLLDELVTLADEHSLDLVRVHAETLLARRALLVDDEEGALTAVTRALTALDDARGPDEDRREALREHRTTLQGAHRHLAAALSALGLHEVAIPLLVRARSRADRAGDAVARARCDVEHVRIAASWGLRLRRAGRDASEHLDDAARRAAPLLAEPTLLPADHRAVLRAAGALARRPAGVPDATGRRRGAEDVTAAAARDARALADDGPAAPPHPGLVDHLLVALARGHALALAGRPVEAAGVLAAVRAGGPRGEPNLLLAVSRELALVGGRGDQVPLRDYTADLEQELWTLQQARLVSLSTRLAHEQLRREHGEVTVQALTDPLTGLPNRRALDGILADRLASGAAPGVLAVAMIDVDRFKSINDRTSHQGGDEVLRRVAESLRRSLRADDVVARYGGDEFVVVLPGSGGADAEAALLRAVAGAAEIPAGDGSTVSLSVGVAGTERAGVTTPGTLLARADRAMYTAKRAGGGAVVRDRGADRPGNPGTDAATRTGHRVVDRAGLGRGIVETAADAHPPVDTGEG